VLTITERCNLDCVYCFETNKTRREMSPAIAQTIIANEFARAEDYDEIEIDLFGGEPTLRKEFIKDLVAWINRQSFQKPYIVFIETNGTLVHGEFQTWLTNNKEHVWIGLSLDGTPDTHNENRNRSYDDIDIGFFVEHYPKQPVRMTIHPTRVDRLCDDIMHLHSLGFGEIVATFAHGTAWDIPGIAVRLRLTLDHLCDYYLAHPHLKECSIFGMNLPAIFREDKGIKKWCGTGTHMVSYDTDGKKYPCHVFQTFSIGDSAAVWEEMKGPVDFDRIADFRDPECSSCIIEGICPNCYGMNYVMNENALRRDKQLCSVVKVQALANSYLAGENIKRGAKKIDPRKAVETIRAIELIQEQLADVE
jgi:uncharacterized protein